MKYLFLTMMLFTVNIYSQVKVKCFEYNVFSKLERLQHQIDEFIMTHKVISVSTSATEGRFLILITYE